MDNNNHDDDDRNAVTRVLDSVVFYRYIANMQPMTAYNVVRAVLPDMTGLMLGKVRTLGQIPGVEIGDDFVYRQEMRLVGLHRDMIRGISKTTDDEGTELAACLVANFQDHNTFVHVDLFVYGGDGGRLIQTHRMHLRVLDHQLMKNGNQAMVTIAAGNIYGS